MPYLQQVTHPEYPPLGTGMSPHPSQCLDSEYSQTHLLSPPAWTGQFINTMPRQDQLCRECSKVRSTAHAYGLVGGAYLTGSGRSISGENPVASLANTAQSCGWRESSRGLECRHNAPCLAEMLCMAANVRLLTKSAVSRQAAVTAMAHQWVARHKILVTKS